MITKEEYIKAIDESIAHWNKDIVIPHQYGYIVNREVSGSGNCSLCLICEEKISKFDFEMVCQICPLAWIGQCCNLMRSPWKIYRAALSCSIDEVIDAMSVVTALKNARKFVEEKWDGESIPLCDIRN